MPSSGSTRSPPASRAPRLLLWVAGDDDPRVCTGLKLLRFRRAERVGDPDRLRPPPVVLDPHAPLALSLADLDAARRGGILVVDCSWNQLARRGRFPGPDRPGRPRPLARRLPYLLAANPQHFGRMGELNTVEALSAALYVLGFRAEAARLLEGFRGGPAFLDVNHAPLELFALAGSSDEVAALERRAYGGEQGPELEPAAGAVERTVRSPDRVRRPPRRG